VLEHTHLINSDEIGFDQKFFSVLIKGYDSSNGFSLFSSVVDEDGKPYGCDCTRVKKK